MQTSESWRPVVGWEGLYEVSDQGRVRSLTRKVRFGRGTRIARGKVLKPILLPSLSTDYYVVTLQSPERRNTQRRIHWLVLEAFVGPRPPKHDGCHGAGGNLDNRLTNLRWDTRSENVHDQSRHGTHRNTKKTRCPRGHLLKAPNLLVRKNNSRVCKTCKAADSTVQAEDISLEQARDRHYLRIMLQDVA